MKSRRSRRGSPATSSSSEATAIIYTRCSTLEQSQEGVGLEVQAQRCRAYCALAGLVVVEVIVDPGLSGSKPLANRPGGQELHHRLGQGAARNVVCLRLDRAFRNAADALVTTENWDRSGISLHLVDMAGMAVSTAGPMGRFLLCMLAGCAELERNLIAERTRAALAHKRQQGVRLGRPRRMELTAGEVAVAEKI